MKKLMPFLLGSVMLFTVACGNTETSTTETNLSEETTEEVAPETATELTEETTEATETTESTEVAETVDGSAEVVDDTAIEAEVISSLATSFPNSQLTVDAEQGAVIVEGSVASEDELNQIEPLVTQVKGVKSVDVKATVSTSGI